MGLQAFHARSDPDTLRRSTVVGLSLALAIGALIVGGNLNRVDAQGTAESALFPTTLGPGVSTIPASGADISLTVTLENLYGGNASPQAVYDLRGPDLDMPDDVADPGPPASLPDPSLCLIQQIMGAGTVWQCTYTVSVPGGTAGSATQRAALVAVAYEGNPGTLVGSVTDPVTIEYAVAGADVSYDPGPGGTVSWSQAAGTVGVGVQTATGGTISVSGSPAGGGTPEYELVGQTMDLTAAADACSPADPCTLTFHIAQGAGADPLTAVVLRNGNSVPECPASPRCVSERTTFGNGDTKLVVVADELSTWNIGRPFITYMGNQNFTGNTTIGAGDVVKGDVRIVDGDLRVRGTIAGDVTQEGPGGVIVNGGLVKGDITESGAEGVYVNDGGTVKGDIEEHGAGPVHIVGGSRVAGDVVELFDGGVTIAGAGTVVTGSVEESGDGDLEVKDGALVKRNVCEADNGDLVITSGGVVKGKEKC